MSKESIPSCRMVKGGDRRRRNLEGKFGNKCQKLAGQRRRPKSKRHMTDTRTHTHKNARTHTRTHALTHTCVHKCPYTCMQWRMHQHTHTHTHTFTHTTTNRRKNRTHSLPPIMPPPLTHSPRARPRSHFLIRSILTVTRWLAPQGA